MTDFPDIRKKCAIQSGSGGSILLIPREGGQLFRMYVDLGEARADNHDALRATTVEEIVAHANAILSPYSLDVKNVAWHSVYEVGHRVTDRFDDVPLEEIGVRMPRVFIEGDACHTHSAKAGQGMNVSMQDGFNLGWKLGYVLSGRSPQSLLTTYSAERQVIAQNLIDFDKEWSTLMAKKPEEFTDPAELADFYVRTTEFLFGFMTQYPPSMLVAEPTHQALAAGFPVGKRFTSARVVRVADANPLHLGHEHRADGRWRVYAFADAEAAALAAWADWMTGSPDSPVMAHTRAGEAVDGVLDIKVVYQQPHVDVDIAVVPELFQPRTGPFGLVDHENVFAIDPDDDIFELRGVDRSGCVVVVRPDQYVAAVLPLDATARARGVLPAAPAGPGSPTGLTAGSGPRPDQPDARVEPDPVGLRVRNQSRSGVCQRAGLGLRVGTVQGPAPEGPAPEERHRVLGRAADEERDGHRFQLDGSPPCGHEQRPHAVGIGEPEHARPATVGQVRKRDVAPDGRPGDAQPRLVRLRPPGHGGEATAGSRGASEAAERRDRVGEEHEPEARDHDVERRRREGMGLGVVLDERDGVRGSGARPGQGEHGGRDVDAGDGAGLGERGSGERRRAVPAAHVEHVLAGPDRRRPTAGRPGTARTCGRTGRGWPPSDRRRAHPCGRVSGSARRRGPAGPESRRRTRRRSRPPGR